MRYDNINFKGLVLPLPFCPDVPLSENDIFVITSENDRYDKLSMDFYGKSDYWWIIMVANMDVIHPDSLVIPPGTQIRIPGNPGEYEIKYNEDILVNIN